VPKKAVAGSRVTRPTINPRRTMMINRQRRAGRTSEQRFPEDQVVPLPFFLFWCQSFSVICFPSCLGESTTTILGYGVPIYVSLFNGAPVFWYSLLWTSSLWCSGDVVLHVFLVMSCMCYLMLYEHVISYDGSLSIEQWNHLCMFGKIYCLIQMVTFNGYCNEVVGPWCCLSKLFLVCRVHWNMVFSLQFCFNG
jgi:hypothetical protein